MRRSSISAVLALAVVVTTPAGTAFARGAAPDGSRAPGAPRQAEDVQADFDGDGLEDVAIGVPGESVGSVVAAGAVNVLYGAPAGLSGAGSQLFHQDVGDIGSTAEAGDGFGLALATGDFDGDGFADLAVGAPGEAVGSAAEAGAVNVLFGSADGLTATGSQLITQATLGGGATSGAGELFGLALAAGDLDGDGVDDLAIGVPFGNALAGSVHVVFGAAGGLGAGRATASFHQDSPGLADTAEAFDEFGAALAVGDFNRSGVADLAIGVPGENVGTVTAAGGVHVLFGRTTGINGTSSQFFTQATPGVGSDPEDGDFFGAALGAGDFDGGGFVDLAIGVPNESVGSVPGAGALNLLEGATGGLTTTGSQVLHQNVGDIGSTAEPGDAFGWAFGTGDFDGDGLVDLAVGVPFESVGTVPQAGAVNVIFGSAGVVTPVGTQLLHQDVTGVGSTAEEFDTFGFAFAAGDVQGDGPDDLVVGVPFEAVGTAGSAGAVNAFTGGGRLSGGAVLHQDVAGIGSTAEPADEFGFALAAPGHQVSGVSTTTASASRVAPGG
ncbi:MAG TPA: hypothetical protein VF743_00405 [Acidimicrobiales bacterium]